MTGDGNRVLPKRYGLLKGRVQIADDFDTLFELAELRTLDMPETDAGKRNDRIQFGREPLSDELLKIARRCAARLVEDAREPDEIIGYNEHGLPVDLTKSENGAKRNE